jgi:drug/metabolite transporter (DMT)-like permease
MAPAHLLLRPELHRAAVFHMRSAVGLLLALIAAVFNGTFGVFAKDEVKGPDVDIFVFHFWASLGLACTGVLFLLFAPIVWTPMGVISGALLVLSSACAFWAASESLVVSQRLADFCLR